MQVLPDNSAPAASSAPTFVAATRRSQVWHSATPGVQDISVELEAGLGEDAHADPRMLRAPFPDDDAASAASHDKPFVHKKSVIDLLSAHDRAENPDSQV
jgi:hypothetical protein